MFMQKIRRSTKKNRTILLIIVALLAIGIVGSFAVWNSGDYSMPGATEVTYADMVAQYEQYLAENAPESMEGIDYNTAITMANDYMALAENAGMAAADASTTEDGADAASAYMLTQMDASTEAVDYFKKAIELAPESLNEEGEAALYSDLAYAQYYAGIYDDARVNFDKAYAASPNYNVVQSYAQFLFSMDGMESVQKLMDDYMGRFTDQSSEEYTNANALLEYYKALDEIYKSATEGTEDADGDGIITIDEDDLEGFVDDMMSSEETGDDTTEGEEGEADPTEKEVVNE